MNQLVPIETASTLAVVPPDVDDYIRSRIFTVRGVQVMLDRDLAEIYGVTTSRLNEQVKRNPGRFPASFVFRLSRAELDYLKSQNATSRPGAVASGRLKSQNATSSWGGVRKPSNAFTEHGIIMLASVLKSDVAVAASVRITNTFVSMRKALVSMAPVLTRLEAAERRQIADQTRNEERFDAIFKAMDGGDFPPQKVFYDGQFWEARSLALKLIERSKRSLILIDNWATPEVLDLFAKKRPGVKVTIFTSEHYDKKHVPHPKISEADVKTFNAQYPKLAVRFNESFHDRFLIIDDRELYLIGASLKDLGKKCFAFTKLDSGEIRHIKKSAFATVR